MRAQYLTQRFMQQMGCAVIGTQLITPRCINLQLHRLVNLQCPRLDNGMMDKQAGGFGGIGYLRMPISPVNAPCIPHLAA